MSPTAPVRASVVLVVALATALQSTVQTRAAPARVLHENETIRATLPGGSPEEIVLAVEFEARASGPIAVEARSLDFDTGLRISRIDSAGKLAPLGEDDDGGIGTNSRLVIEAKRRDRYRIEVHPVEEDWGGEFEVSVATGRAPALEGNAKADADLAYWQQVESRAHERGSLLREARALEGRGLLLRGSVAYAQAKPLLERVLAIREAQLGPEHPDVVQSLDNLAGVLQDMGEYTAARPLFERVLAICEAQPGLDHLEISQSLSNLAGLLRDMGEYAQARPLLERALAICEKQRGPRDPLVALSLNNLSGVLRDLGEYAAARPLLERALAICESQKDPEPRDIAQSLNNLAGLLRAMGFYAEAKSLLERALAICEKHPGPGHLDVATSLNNLASFLQATGAYAQAKPLYERALAIREKQLGPENRDVATSLENLGCLLQDMGTYAEAKPLMERAHSIFEKQLGPEHRDVATSLNNLALLLRDMGASAEARPLMERALAISEKQLGPEHPAVAMSLNSLAVLLRDMGAYAEAEPLLRRALTILERQLGPEHPSVALSLKTLARLLARSGRRGEALDVALRAEGVSRRHLERTARTLAERYALLYASARISGVNLALTLAPALGPDARRQAWDALVHSRALVLDEMAARHRAVAGTEDPETARLAQRFSIASQRLANLTVRGPVKDAPAPYRALLEEARGGWERAEEALAEKSSSYRAEQSRTRVGLEEVAAALLEV